MEEVIYNMVNPHLRELVISYNILLDSGELVDSFSIRSVSIDKIILHTNLATGDIDVVVVDIFFTMVKNSSWRHYYTLNWRYDHLLAIIRDLKLGQLV